MRNRIVSFLFILVLFPTLASHAGDRHEAVVTAAAARQGHKDYVVLWSEIVVASYYAKGFHGKRTSNGEIFNTYAYTVAHPDLPFGTKIRVCRKGKCVEARVNDRGPFIPGRGLDVSYQIALDLDLVKPGYAPVLMEVLA
jgi:rare lipoprotein A (peptidoglycan hydrolase)